MSFKRVLKFVSLFTLITIIAIGCSGSNGSNGAAGANGKDGKDGNPGAPGLSTGNISGTVVDSASQTPIAGATVAINPAVASNATTDANGDFSFPAIPIGSYQAVVSMSGYNQFTSSVIPVVAGVTSTTQVLLIHGPYQAPLISGLSNQLNVGYGSTVALSATVTDPNGLSVTCKWTISSPLSTAPVLIGGSTNCSSVSFTTDTLASLATLDPSLQQLLAARDAIVPVSYNEMGGYTLKLSATNSKGVNSSSSVTVRASDKQPGLQNVAVGVPVYLNFTETTPNITFVKPSGSSASISPVAAGSFTVRVFTPDVAGQYGITETTYNNSFIISAGSWVGAYGSDGVFGHGTIGGAQCTTCHNDIIAPNKFTPVGLTAHATIFTNGINGGSGTIGSSCFPCHTVGYDQATLANNNGFDDVAAQYGFVFPKILQPGNWTAMLGQYPTVAALANIQCDSCHGPSNSLAHMSTNLVTDTGARIGWNAGACTQCHDAPTHHVIGPQWESSSHADFSLAIAEGAGGSTSCERCHAAQGFYEYISETTHGVNGPGLTNGSNSLQASKAYLKSIGLTPSQVQPQTCQACHDPHDATNPGQLRVYGDTFTLAGGFTGSSVGAGAICMECHNTRNGKHDDSTGISNYTAPHTPSQSDMLEGQNSYFTDIPNVSYLSKHANIGDTCVTCHMLYNPEKAAATYGHTFAILSTEKGQVCQNCHGVGTTGDGLQTEVDDLLATLGTQMAKHLVTGINLSAATYDVWINNYDPVSGNSTPALIAQAGASTPITAASFSEIHGQEGFLMWITATAYYSNMGSFITAPAGIAPTAGAFTVSTLYSVFPLNGSNASATTLVKACWNYALVEGDGSLGIHNPTYILTILDNSIQQLP